MYQNTLRMIALEYPPPYGLQPAATAQQLVTLRANAHQILGSDIPEPYLALLQRTNGLVYNGLVIYACERVAIVGSPNAFIDGLIEVNVDYRDIEELDRFLIIAESGLSSYCCNLDTQQFEVRDRTSFSRPEPQASFEQMLADALENHHSGSSQHG